MEYNINTLIDLYKIFSPSRNERKIKKFIRRYCANIPGISVKTDPAGNIYATKGIADNYPVICSHLDQVQRSHSKDFDVINHNGVLLGYSNNNKRQEGLGADDKNGVFVCLECLRILDTVKCAFFVGEEIGCYGSEKADIEFFQNARFIIEADRRNAGDLITDICGPVCSDDFLTAILPICYKYGYKTEYGLMTDIKALLNNGVNVSCINVSCGYYHPHTDEEITVLSELCNCLDFILEIVNTITGVFPFSRYGGNSDYYDDAAYYCDEDCDTMNDILKQHPYYTFEDIKNWYKDCFICQDDDILNDIFNDCNPDINREFWRMQKTFQN